MRFSSKEYFEYLKSEINNPSGTGDMYRDLVDVLSMEDDKDAVLGTFEIDDMEYNYDLVSFDECTLVGGALIPKERKYKGLVTLDTNTGMYNLHYDRYLNEEKKKLIVTSFGLACKEYTWIYNKEKTVDKYNYLW